MYASSHADTAALPNTLVFHIAKLPSLQSYQNNHSWGAQITRSNLNDDRDSSISPKPLATSFTIIMAHTTTRTFYSTLTLLLILTLSTTSLASPFNHAVSTTPAINIHHSLPPPPRLQPRSPAIPPVLSALNATHVVLLRSYQFHPAGTNPSTVLSAFFDAAYTLATNRTLASQVLQHGLSYYYGLLKMQILSEMQLTWEVVQHVVRVMEDFVPGLPMFFVAALQMATGYWVFVMFGIEPQWWLWRRDGLDVP